MNRQRILPKLLAALFLVGVCLSPVPAWAEPSLEDQADSIVEQAPITLTEFLQDPGGTLGGLLFDGIAAAWEDQADRCAKLLLYLLLAGALALAHPTTGAQPILELICAAGAFLLLQGSALDLVADFCTCVTEWKTFLISFAPVYAAVLFSGGHPTLAAAYSGGFLTVIQLLAYGIETFLLPLLTGYLAVAAAGVLSGSDEISALCRLAGSAVQKAVKAAGVLFAAIMGLQKVFGASVDSAALQAGQTLSSAIPLVGQALSTASATVLSAAAVLRSGVGFAAIAVIGVEFVPFFLRLLLQLLFLHLCVLLSKTFSLDACGELFRCTILALEVVCALAALFFSMIVVATALVMEL